MSDKLKKIVGKEKNNDEKMEAASSVDVILAMMRLTTLRRADHT